MCALSISIQGTMYAAARTRQLIFILRPGGWNWISELMITHGATKEIVDPLHH